MTGNRPIILAEWVHAIRHPFTPTQAPYQRQ